MTPNHSPPTWREGWWHEAFPRTANASERRGHAKGAELMYCIVAYDIADPKRLKKVADTCLNYGVRVQLSIFECRIPADTFARLWEELCAIADPADDKIVAYPIHGAAAQNIRTFGTMVCSEQVVAYIF
jgi:CRISPR-associated protein Cas2